MDLMHKLSRAKSLLDVTKIMEKENEDEQDMDAVIDFKTPVISWFYLFVILLISIGS
jgi:MFS family permease